MICAYTFDMLNNSSFLNLKNSSVSTKYRKFSNINPNYLKLEKKLLDFKLNFLYINFQENSSQQIWQKIIRLWLHGFKSHKCSKPVINYV